MFSFFLIVGVCFLEICYFLIDVFFYVKDNMLDIYYYKEVLRDLCYLVDLRMECCEGFVVEDVGD